MKVLYVTSEAAPFAKSGGLGDVAGSLPKVLKQKDVDIRVIMPLYRDIPDSFKEKMEVIGNYEVEMNWRHQKCEISRLTLNDVVYYFVGNSYYFDREGLYGYFDEAERYLFFSKAVLDFVPKFDFWPDIVHCNDWQSAIVPFLLEKQYRNHYRQLKTVLSIHNIKYQGVYGEETIMDILGLKKEDLTRDIEFNGDTNMLKAGIYNADWVTTVSPTYARELEYEYYGEGLHGVIKSNNHKMTGILNGLDYETNNPQTDTNLYVNYTKSIKKKNENKRQFMRELNLKYDEDKPLVGIVSRLDELKGIDLVTGVIYEIMKLGINLVVLGTGDKKYEDVFRHIHNSFPDTVSVNIAFDSAIASKIYAASDIILMPSRVEPCGLTQIIALKYGAVPLVRRTGGLNDTITKFDIVTGEGNGFVFSSYNAHEMLSELNRAVCLFRKNRESWNQLVANTFKSKFDWSQSANQYIEIYDKLIKG
jgi:starch synthase